MDKVLFYIATRPQYDALETKNPYALYFLADTGELFKGDIRFGFPTKLVTSFPATGELGLLYVNNAGQAKIWNGDEYIAVGGSTADLFLSSAVRHVVTAEEAGTGIYAGMVAGDIGILFTMNNNTKMFVKLTDLVDTYTADNSTAKGVTVTVGGYSISAEAKISAVSGNQAELKNDGIYVPPLEWQVLPI